MSALPIKRNQVYLIGEEFYWVAGDFSEVRTENDYQLENVTNENDKFQVSEREAVKNIQNNKWKRVRFNES